MMYESHGSTAMVYKIYLKYGPEDYVKDMLNGRTLAQVCFMERTGHQC